MLSSPTVTVTELLFFGVALLLPLGGGALLLYFILRSSKKD
ncbi:MAG TPA: hypothetical protein VNO21_09805 [Polyangiaceae bacterium]|nr:hypothetical protein [Polyangiaceae bacterium]